MKKRVKEGGLIDLTDAALAALYLRGLPKRYEILVRTIEPKDDELANANINGIVKVGLVAMGKPAWRTGSTL